METPRERHEATELDADHDDQSGGKILLSARGLRKTFGGEVVLNGLDFDLHEGEVVLLRGENGSGKTTLINILTGNIEPDSGAIHYSSNGSSRAYEFPRRLWQGLGPQDHFRPEFVAQSGIGRTWQDVRLFNSQSLRDNIAVGVSAQPGENPLRTLFTPRHTRRVERQVGQKADKILADLDLGGREDSSADKISLGQSKRVAIARAFAAGARLFFLDEPLAGLDRQGIINVLALLESLIRQHRVTVVVVEHVFNQIHLHGLLTTDWLLANGRIQRTASEKIIGNRNTLTPQHRPAWFDLLVPSRAEVLEETLPRGAILTRIRSGKRGSESRKILEIRNLVVNRGSHTSIGLDDGREISGLNLALYEGETAVLQAPNGWGKTTLGEAIIGLIPIDRGEILFDGQDIKQLHVWQRARARLHFVPARSNVFPTLTVEESLRAAGIQDAPPHLKPLLQRTAAQLSGGERQKLSLASVPANSRLVVYDEPFSALDSAALMTHANTIVQGHNAKLIMLPQSDAPLSTANETNMNSD
ncbi:MAG TPA: ATP-binding cassette domain-containing protein [Chthoniobacterales bacterium]|nr:ATP-binding cassette domain-containing protein [Chthoniobacterales bacterium]